MIWKKCKIYLYFVCIQSWWWNCFVCKCVNVWVSREGGWKLKKILVLLEKRSHYTSYLLLPTYHFNLHLWRCWYLLNMYWCVVSLCFILPVSFPFIWPPSAFWLLHVWNENEYISHISGISTFPCFFLTYYVVIQ